MGYVGFGRYDTNEVISNLGYYSYCIMRKITSYKCYFICFYLRTFFTNKQSFYWVYINMQLNLKFFSNLNFRKYTLLEKFVSISTGQKIVLSMRWNYMLPQLTHDYYVTQFNIARIVLLHLIRCCCTRQIHFLPAKSNI